MIQFAGGATDAQDGPLPASALSWTLILHHCPSNCHQHGIQSFDGVAGGSFATPDHEYPSHLELRLTARDSGGLADTESVQLDPRTVTLTLNSSPGGFALTLNGSQAATPFTRTVIQGSRTRSPPPRHRPRPRRPGCSGPGRRRRADARRDPPTARPATPRPTGSAEPAAGPARQTWRMLSASCRVVGARLCPVGGMLDEQALCWGSRRRVGRVRVVAGWCGGCPADGYERVA